jgi:hypothetical protein
VKLPRELVRSTRLEIEVGCFSVTKSTLFYEFPCGRQRRLRFLFRRVESPDNVSYASLTRNFSTCFVFLLLTEQFLFVVIGPPECVRLNAPPR